MLFVYDGEDIVTSRDKLLNSLPKDAEVVRIDGKKASLADIDNAIVSGSLFSAKRAIIIEYFSKIKPQAKLFELIDKYISDKETSIYLWEAASIKNKEVTKKGIIHFTFDFPKVFYAFLDGLTPGTSKKNIMLLSQVLKNTAAELVLFSIIKRVRLLLYMKGDNYMEFAEIKKMAPWQIGKLQQQAALWSEESLKKFIIELGTLDEKLKTSSNSLPLTKHLDILLITALN